MTLVLLGEGEGSARIVSRVPEGGARREDALRDLLFAQPAMLELVILDSAQRVEVGVGRGVADEGVRGPQRPAGASIMALNSTNEEMFTGRAMAPPGQHFPSISAVVWLQPPAMRLETTTRAPPRASAKAAARRSRAKIPYRSPLCRRMR